MPPTPRPPRLIAGKCSCRRRHTAPRHWAFAGHGRAAVQPASPQYYRMEARMRNPRMESLWIGRVAYLSWLGAAGLMMAGACADNSQQRQELNAGEDALRAQQYDRALRAADDVSASGVAANAAEAHYLRGRSIEDRPKSDPAAAKVDLAEARRDYS